MKELTMVDLPVYTIHRIGDIYYIILCIITIIIIAIVNNLWQYTIPGNVNVSKISLNNNKLTGMISLMLLIQGFMFYCLTLSLSLMLNLPGNVNNLRLQDKDKTRRS